MLVGGLLLDGQVLKLLIAADVSSTHQPSTANASRDLKDDDDEVTTYRVDYCSTLIAYLSTGM